MRVLAVAPGPDRHGVVQHALTVARLLLRAEVETTVSRTLARPTDAFDVTHAHFTDALYGRDIDAAAECFVNWAADVPRPLVVTLHDVPGLDPDRARDTRRVAGYQRVAGASDAVVVSAEHELAGAWLNATVVPLPVEPLAPAGPPPPWAGRRTVGVLGFVYPGKGHDVVLRAVAPGTVVVALGGVSPGHDGYLHALCAEADRLGLELLVTGPLSESALHAAALAVTVPVAAYRTLGASASLATWLACGRRPVTTHSAYADGIERRWPGSLSLTDDLRGALADPPGTWLEGPPPRPDIAAAHLEVFRSCRS